MLGAGPWPARASRSRHAASAATALPTRSPPTSLETRVRPRVPRASVCPARRSSRSLHLPLDHAAPVTRAPLVSVDPQHDDRGVDPVEVVVGHDERGRSRDSEIGPAGTEILVARVIRGRSSREAVARRRPPRAARRRKPLTAHRCPSWRRRAGLSAPIASTARVPRLRNHRPTPVPGSVGTASRVTRLAARGSRHAGGPEDAGAIRAAVGFVLARSADEAQDSQDDDDADEEPACPSCRRRRWQGLEPRWRPVDDGRSCRPPAPVPPSASRSAATRS